MTKLRRALRTFCCSISWCKCLMSKPPKRGKTLHKPWASHITRWQQEHLCNPAIYIRGAWTIANDSSLHRHWWSYWRKPCCSWASILLGILAVLYLWLAVEDQQHQQLTGKINPTISISYIETPLQQGCPSIPGSCMAEPLEHPTTLHVPWSSKALNAQVGGLTCPLHPSVFWI